MAFQRPDIFEASDAGYVFAGGNQGRDWETLFRAVEGLPFPVTILTTRTFAAYPANVTIAKVSRQEYYRRMAAASCVVVPLLPEPLRITGTTTWINAMGTGKVAIVTEPHGAPDYMEQGVSGFYVNYGDAEGLRQCIQRVMGDAELRRRVGQAARERAFKEFSPETFRRGVLALLRGDSKGAAAMADYTVERAKAATGSVGD
jgi:glycosyltransferase involved in cell wall biosynthesis